MSGTKSEFRIGEHVYHNTPESERGLILDVIYSSANDSYSYLVAVGWNNEYVCREYELTREKLF